MGADWERSWRAFVPEAEAALVGVVLAGPDPGDERRGQLARLYLASTGAKGSDAASTTQPSGVCTIGLHDGDPMGTGGQPPGPLLVQTARLAGERRPQDGLPAGGNPPMMPAGPACAGSVPRGRAVARLNIGSRIRR